MKKSAALDDDIKATEKAINAKVKSYDIMNRELEKLVEAAGGLELDPNEIKVLVITYHVITISAKYLIDFQVKSLEKKLADLEIETREAQNFWLRLQKHVVNLSEKRSLQQAKISLTSKRLLISFDSVKNFTFSYFSFNRIIGNRAKNNENRFSIRCFAKEG